MASIPHGGTLVDLVLEGKTLQSARRRARKCRSVTVDFDTLLDAEKIAIGAFSPLRGFMTQHQLQAVMDNLHLPTGEVWSLPILLFVPEDIAHALTWHEEIVIRDPKGRAIFLMEVEDMFRVVKKEVAQKIFGTTDKKHPGVARLAATPPYAVGGEICLLRRPDNPFQQYEMDPKATRARFRQMECERIVGFQTRNPPHRAHEYLQRCALEMVDGLLIQPILGTLKAGDFSTNAIMDSYKVLVENFFPKNRVLLSGLSTWMRYAGPREAVFHAIVRKNYGCTHFSVGRDHAGVGNYYDPYAAHNIFNEIESEIGIEILKATASFYCRRCGGLASDKTCGHDADNHLNISMSAVRQMLRDGQFPPPDLIRPEVARTLVAHLDKDNA